MANPTDAVGGPVRSSFAGHPEFVAILPKYLEHLRMQRARLERVWGEQDWPALETIAHQLKGSGGSYGFAELSARAATLETDAGAVDAGAVDDVDAARISGSLTAVTEYIDRIIA